jgi:hypothetical protein
MLLRSADAGVQRIASTQDGRVIAADLSETEQLLWEAFPRGAWADLRGPGSGLSDLDNAGSWGQDRVIRAEVIRALLLGAAEAERGSVPGVRLRGARVTGRLDLTSATVPWPLTCEWCHFEEEIVLAESSLRALRIVNSRFPAFNGARMTVEGLVSLQECTGAAAVRLEQARVVGEVSLQGATIGQDTSAVAVSADGLWVDGDVNCTGLITRGAVSMQGLQVTGSLNLTDARILQPGPHALAVGNASIGRRVIGRGLQVDGEFLIHDTTVTRIELTGARLLNPGGLALSAGGLTVTGGMFCSGLTAHGRVSLVGARLGANLSFAKSALTNPGAVALGLDRATIGYFDGLDLLCSGQVSLRGTRIASDMNFERARIDGGGRPAIDADGAVIDGTLWFREMRASGEVTLRTGRIGQRVILTRAQLENPAGSALALSGTEIASDLFCRDATFTGEVRLRGIQIRGHIDLDHVRLTNPARTALNAMGMQAGEFSLRPADPVRGTVNLSHVRVGVFRDDPASWPETLNLDGLTYAALEPQLPAQQRLRWLAQDGNGHELQPYEQLAAHYNRLGQPAEASRVLYARERLQRRNRTPVSRAWSFLQDITVAYGYQPWRALLWLALLLTAGSVVFTLNPPPPLQASAAPHFNAVIYTLDLLLPVVNLGQKYAFNPAGATQWFAYLLTGAGWVLATTVAAGAARILSRR